MKLKHEDLLAIYRGKLAEQFVAQELLALQDAPIFNKLTRVDQPLFAVNIKMGKYGQQFKSQQSLS